MANLYNKTPSDTQVALDLLVVFNHLTTDARALAAQVVALVDFDFAKHNKNAIPKWQGADYFVMVRGSFGYLATREKLQQLQQDGRRGCRKQVKNIYAGGANH